MLDPRNLTNKAEAKQRSGKGELEGCEGNKNKGNRETNMLSWYSDCQVATV